MALRFRIKSPPHDRRRWPDRPNLLGFDLAADEHLMAERVRSREEMSDRLRGRHATARRSEPPDGDDLGIRNDEGDGDGRPVAASSQFASPLEALEKIGGDRRAIDEAVTEPSGRGAEAIASDPPGEPGVCQMDEAGYGESFRKGGRQACDAAAGPASFRARTAILTSPSASSARCRRCRPRTPRAAWLAPCRLRWR